MQCLVGVPRRVVRGRCIIQPEEATPMGFAEKQGVEHLRLCLGRVGVCPTEHREKKPRGSGGSRGVKGAGELGESERLGDDHPVQADGLVGVQRHHDRCRECAEGCVTVEGVRNPVVEPLDGGREEPGLVAEIRVDSALARRAPAGDGLDDRGREPVGQKKGHGRVEDERTSGWSVFVGHTPPGCGHPLIVLGRIINANHRRKDDPVGSRILHVAISDDWEASRNFGEYEVSTRGIGLFDAGYIRATTAEGLDTVLRRRYADLHLPLLVIVIDIEALESSGVGVVWADDDSASGRSPRIDGILPMNDDVVVAVLPIERQNESLAVPDLTGLGASS